METEVLFWARENGALGVRSIYYKKFAGKLTKEQILPTLYQNYEHIRIDSVTYDGKAMLRRFYGVAKILEAK